MNKKDIIIKELETMSNKETINKNFFKVRAYNKVINQLKNIEYIASMDDIKNVQGIGIKIKTKIEEILKTGKLKAAEKARQITKNGSSKIDIYNELLQIHGIGIVKAKELIENYNIKSINELNNLVKRNPNILNNQQQVGLKYHYDIKETIPRKEMEKHLRKINKIVKLCCGDEASVKLVGSYRRGAIESGDIDIIIKSSSNLKKMLDKIISKLKKEKYIIDELSIGSKKFMGICQVNTKSKARRIDILMTTPKEYPFALLYFTGNFDINILLRKKANELGFILNEYNLRSPQKEIMELDSEKKIFNFLGYKYLQPKARIATNLEPLE